MKILNIITGGLRREGITSSQLEFVRHMDFSHMQMDIAAVTRNDPKVIEEFEEAGCKVIIFPDRKKFTIKYVIALYKQLKKEKYDIVHVHGSSSMMVVELKAAKMAGVKVRIAHSRNTLTRNSMMHRILYPMFSKSYTHALACGEDAGKWLFNDGKYTVLHNGKDLTKFMFNNDTRQRIREEKNIENKLVIGYVGNLNEQKNLKFLIDVFGTIHKKKSDTILYMIGDGYLREELVEQVKRLGISGAVVFTGRIYNVPELLQAMDIMLLPSLYEGLPNVVLEWQAAGLKSYVSNTVTKECAVCDLVEFLPINQGVDIWVNRLLQYEFEDREFRSESGCNCLAKEHFEINETTRFVKKFYEECIENIQ